MATFIITEHLAFLKFSLALDPPRSDNYDIFK